MTEHRLTVLETESQHNAKAIELLTIQVTELNAALARYRGAWGMVIMIGASLAGAVAIWVEYTKG